MCRSSGCHSVEEEHVQQHMNGRKHDDGPRMVNVKSRTLSRKNRIIYPETCLCYTHLHKREHVQVTLHYITTTGFWYGSVVQLMLVLELDNVRAFILANGSLHNEW